ncbi:MAG TPA: hypothetical protein P5040_04705 [Smithella sp.]|nr:hypothetical protein [Smithella sp.]
MSKEFKHTEGPWGFGGVCGHISDNGGFTVTSSKGVVICSREPCEPLAKEMVANGYLIAAAPELLEAIELALTFVSDILDCGMSQSQEVRDLESALKEAISKAKGDE